MIERPAYLSKIRPFIGKPLVKVFTGIRRSGKTVLLELVRRELLSNGLPEHRMISINFESFADPSIRDADTVYAMIREASARSSEPLMLFLDEIQELEGWERVVNACMVDFDLDIYITGSNANLLSGELATFLAGRYVEIKVYPFSFEEALRAGRTHGDRRGLKEAFYTYVRHGGMPFVYDAGLEAFPARQYLSDVFDSIILKDIAQRNKVRDVDRLKRLILFLVAGIGTTFSSSSLAKYLKNEHRSLSPETLYNYIEYCREACLLHLVPRQELRGKSLLSFQEKIYIADHGLREALYGNNTRDIQQTLENIVYMELLRRDWLVRIGKIGDAEVDFVAERGNERMYVQVAYLLASVDTVKREFSPLSAIPDNFPKLVLSMDEVAMGREGIIHRNVAEWLLDSSW